MIGDIVSIHKITNAFIVKVGCSELAFLDKQGLLKELSEYLDDPIAKRGEYEKKYRLPLPLEQPDVGT